MSEELGECRCCRKPISRSQLACPPHWAMLPKPLKDAIRETYLRKAWREYAANVTQADRIWQDAGIWKPPVPMSVRAKKGVDGLRDLLTPTK
ncbi:hypothetical protein PCC82_04645 [Agrobacterium deltaense]|uniref:hypothetical protein n=1 Tax=Agrobacterium pusense TaxID=648995 RepID=UPI001300B130|nr:hypothetical protein [Agrobacterium pusense]